MSIFQKQLKREAGWDVRVAVVLGVIFALCGLLLPRWTFWYWFTPLALFWFRYLLVRCRRDEELLQADLAASGGTCAPGCYRSEAGICITDGTQHVLVFRNKPDALLQLPHIVGDE